MAQPIALHASVSMSRPGRGVVLVDRHGAVTDRPDWVSLEVFLEVLLDDGSRLSPQESTYVLGRPLDCSRQELENNVRDRIIQQPRCLPGDPRAERPALVRELQAHIIETSLGALAALPLTISLSNEVEARLERASPT